MVRLVMMVMMVLGMMVTQVRLRTAIVKHQQSRGGSNDASEVRVVVGGDGCK